MSVARDLVRAEWRERRRAYAGLAALFLASSATYALVFALVGGLEDRIGSEISDNLAGAVRVTDDGDGLADGALIANAQDVAVALRAASGAAVHLRLEAEALFLHGAPFESTRADAPGVERSAGILVGVDADDDGVQSRYLAQGRPLSEFPREMRAPWGDILVPIVVGREFLSDDVHVLEGDVVTWDSVFNVTAGRIENNQLVSIQCVVVGAYSTGFHVIDRGVVFAPRGAVGRLVGAHPEAPPANTLVLRGGEADAAVARAHELELTATTDAAFRERYLGPVFSVVRVTTWVVIGALTLMTGAWFAQALAHHVTADRRKIATLRAIGIPHHAFARAYAGLALGVGSVGGALGLALAALAAAVVGEVTAASGTPFLPRLAWTESLGLLALAVGAAVAAALFAVRRARRLSVAEALRAP